MKIEILPIKTRKFCPPKDNIFDEIDKLDIKDGDIVFVTSKILSIHQGRTRKTEEITKEELIRENAERYKKFENEDGGFHTNLTVTNGILIAGAGIDESNANSHYILWPKNVDALCKAIRERLIKRTGVKNLGVVATDSHTTPLRWGVTGFAIGLAGIKPLKDIRGVEDIFGREIHITQVNKVDALTSMAVLAMGECNEQTPIAIMRGETGIGFDESANMEGFKIPIENDMYGGILKTIPEVK